MKRIIRLTEKDLAKIVKRILKEDNDPSAPEMPEIPPQEYLDLIASADTEKEMGDDMVTQQVTEYWNKSNNLSRLVRRVINEQYEDDYTASGFDSMGDAAHSALKSKGHSHRGKDDEGEFYIVFDGEKFYEDDFEIAGHNDMGKIPRVEDGKLIIANPAWGS